MIQQIRRLRAVSVVVLTLLLTIPPGFAESFVFRDAAVDRTFSLALDEVAVSRGDTYRIVTAIPPAANRTALIQTVTQRVRDRGEEVELILYEIEDGQRVGTPRVVTREVLLQVAPGVNPEKAARNAGAIHLAPDGILGDYWIARAPDSASALDVVAALRAAKGVMSAEPLLARQQTKKFTPSDTFFTNQWHLRNTGQFNGLAGTDVRITNVWAAGFRGTNIYIAIIDDGLQTAHPDLAANVDTTIDWDFNGNDNDPNPGSGDDHGTACAGVAAAVGNNNLGVSGAAPQARLVGLRLISAAATDQQEANAMNWSNTIIHIKSNSWGPTDSGSILEGPGPLTRAALSNTCAVGRNGRGSLIFWAGGNGLQNSDDSNLDGYANSIYTISVAANDIRGQQAWYSEPGANHIICAPSSGDNNSGADIGIWTTDRTGANGYNTSSTTNGDYATDFGGTSSATPLAAGVGGLMIQANTNLGWRDVQEILIRTATRNHPADSDWRQNGAGYWFNHKYGAGMINASGAVARALTWTNLGPQIIAVTNQTGLSVAIPDNNAAGITRTFNVNAGMRLEHVVATVNINHGARRNLRIELISPAGTTSVLAYASANSGANFANWSFMTARNWGEAVAGTWTLRVADRRSGTTGTLTSAGLTFYGTATDVPSNQPPAILGVANQTVIIGSNLAFAVTATDAIDNDPVTLVASNLPAGATFGVTNGNGFFTWNNVGPTGVYNVIFHASDKDGFAAAPATITVEPVPVFIGGANISAITINDNAAATPYPSTITLNGAGGIIDRVIVTLNGFSHTYPSDVDIVLVGPGGQKSVVMGRVGGAAGVNGLTLTFDDAAESTIGGGLDNGIFKPSGTISTAMPAPAPGLPYTSAFTNFAGLSPYGTWSLYVADRAGQDVGSISGGWGLQIKMAGLAALSNQPPILNAIGPKPVIVSNSLTFAVTASDPYDGDPVTLVASNLPAGASFGATNGIGSFTWPVAAPTGVYAVIFHASDKDGFAAEAVTITVSVPPDFLAYVEDFDVTNRWGGGTAGSYNAKYFTNNAAQPVGDYFESNSAIRDTVDSITGNAWRLGNDSTANVYFRYVITNPVRRFALRAARWDNSPNPQFQIRYSLNSGSTYTTLLSTNGNWFTADKVYRTYDSGPISLTPEAGQKIYLELFRSTGERMLIDNFEVDYIPSGGSEPPPPVYTGCLTAIAFTNSTPVTIPDLGPAAVYPSTITVAGITQLLEKVTVTLFNLNHDFIADLDALLVGPAGQKIYLMASPGLGGQANNATVTFDEAAAGPLPGFGNITSGVYQPSLWELRGDFEAPAPAGPYDQYLGGLIGTSPNGTWSLYLYDWVSLSGGELAGGWSINFEFDCPEPPPPPTNVNCGVIISEYVEGSSNNKAIEIYNGTAEGINLTAENYSLQFFFNGANTAGATIGLTGVVAAGSTYVVANSSANATVLAAANQLSSASWFNGDDAIVLRHGTNIIDSIGQIGFDPGTEWGSGLASTADNTLRRKSTVLSGDTNPFDVFDPSIEWDGYAQDTFDGLGAHVMDCAPPSPDSDNDGIDDAWELFWFGDLVTANATSDWDGDGFIDFHEFLAGTGPKDPNAFLMVDDVKPNANGALIVQWPGATGKVYNVLRTTNLVEAAYFTIATNVPGVVPLNVVTDAPPVPDPAFYRIQLIPAP